VQQEMSIMRPLKLVVVSVCAAAAVGLAGAAQGQPASVLRAVDRVRFLPAPGHEKAMLHGTICGSNVSAGEGFELLAEIKSVPAAGRWTELTFKGRKPYRWIKYAAPAGSRGWVSKIEFYAGQEKLSGELFAPYPVGGWRRAIDDKPAVGVQGEKPDGQFVGIDIGERGSCPRPIFSPAGNEFSKPVTVSMRARMPHAVIRYTTDGTLPTADHGQVYSAAISIDKTTTFAAVAFCEGLAPSPAAEMVYPFSPVVRRNTLHFGNSLSANAVGKFAVHAKTAGMIHDAKLFGMGGGLARTLWNTAMLGPGDPRDEARWKDLFTTTHSMGGVATYSIAQVEKSAADWKRMWAGLSQITDVTFQPRDADIAEEADYTARWLKLVRGRFPDVQPWLYVEWTERERRRATDHGQVPSSQMAKVYPALTWEESMSAMMLYGEEVRLAVARVCNDGKPMRIIPTALAMGWIHHQIQRGELPGVAVGDFAPFLFADGVHVNPEGAFLVEATWFAALYGQSPEGKFLPLAVRLTSPQATAMQRLAWDAIKNYPGCGLYETGTTPCGQTQFSPPPSPVRGVTRVTLVSATPGAWFRYTLDGTVPTRTRGYIYCGVVSVRPGMTLKAVAYRSGMADSGVSAAIYPQQ
jgi:hypothetical protein